MLSSGAVLMGFGSVALPVFPQADRADALADDKQVGTVDFIHEGPVPLDSVVGTELDGRLYTDLSTLSPQNLVTRTENFYIRTRASEFLGDIGRWQVTVDGLVEQPVKLGIDQLRRAAKPQGLHVVECAGNVRLTRFGMLSAADWAGVPVQQILEGSKIRPQATRVLIEGFDRYERESATSVAGASWVFALDELKSAGAFLATEMNGLPLIRDHGAPIRLVVPGWYGCTCIKWVNGITLAGDQAEATSQMLEYAARTMQRWAPRLAREYQPAVIDQAAMPVRIEKWMVHGKIRYKVVGIVWGGTRPLKNLQIRFNPEDQYVPVDRLHQVTNDPWSLWTHVWTPTVPGIYTIQLAAKEPAVRTRRLNSGYYARTVEITEI
jgi:DMSO/TMAO reductase YedYZ molybdopterin-dependent catalytic subunit